MKTLLQPYLLVVALVFASVAVIHLLRAVNTWEFTVGPVDVPVSVSWIGFLVAGVLSLWGFWLAFRVS